jgi:hypothetical protein
MPDLGSKCDVILHRLGSYASAGDSSWTPADFAMTFGLGHADHIALAARSVARLVSFGMARIDPAGLAVRIYIGPLSQRWAAKLPGYLQDAYRNSSAA